MRWFLLVVLTLTFAACSHGNCRGTTGTKDQQKNKEAMVPSTNESLIQRVKVAKPDGSLQCGQGKAVPVKEMQKELKEITVYSSTNKNDGMMRIQVCGAPTGNYNVYEIDRKDLDAALKAGFKEWTFE